MPKRNDKTLDEALKIVAEKNGLEYVEPENRKPLKQLIITDKENNKQYRIIRKHGKIYIKEERLSKLKFLKNRYINKIK